MLDAGALLLDVCPSALRLVALCVGVEALALPFALAVLLHQLVKFWALGALVAPLAAVAALARELAISLGPPTTFDGQVLGVELSSPFA